MFPEQHVLEQFKCRDNYYVFNLAAEAAAGGAGAGHVRDVPRLPLCLHAHTYVYICTDTGWRVGLGRQGGVSMPMPLRDSNDSLNSSTLCLLPAAPV